MLFLYNILLVVASQIVKILALFSPKMKLFVNGRKNVFEMLKRKINPTDKTIWFHAASLGEYEQGLPVMEKIKHNFPDYKIVLTFFSPSGYEVRKNNTVADVTVYLPLDTKANAQKFINSINPEFVFFIKYEYWINYLNQLKDAKIKTYLISGIFRENQAFFKWYGSFYRKALKSFEYFFVQNESSKNLVQSLGFQNVKVSGDTRFDRVVSILERDNSLDFIDSFTSFGLESKARTGEPMTTIVIGSSWQKDEDILVEYINNSPENVKFIIAPHNIKQEQIANLKAQINKKAILYSEYNNDASRFTQNNRLFDYQVFIIDAIGILTKIYSYADIAYVGGGFGNPGVHNVLEPATFGIPIVIGPNYSHFAEAVELVNLEGCVSINNVKELSDAFNLLINNTTERNKKGTICKNFVQMNKGATNIIVEYMLNHLDTKN